MLVKAAWNITGCRSVHFEVPVDGYDAPPVIDITDYYFFRFNCKVLAEDNLLKAVSVQGGSLTNSLKYMLKTAHLLNFADLVQKVFDAFILERDYNSDQTRFLRTVQTIAMQKRKLEVANLYELPFTNFRLIQWRNHLV